jgi:hypothetical protein
MKTASGAKLYCLAVRHHSLYRGFRTKFQNIARLAFERFANRFERRETDGLGLAGFEVGQIGRRDVHGFSQLIQPHFPLREDHVEIDNDGHNLKPSIPVPVEVPALPSIATPQI